MKLFWNHSKQHSSKTIQTIYDQLHQFWNHSKQHSSKTRPLCLPKSPQFWNHSKQHSSKTYCHFDNAWTMVLEPFETTQL